MTPQNCKLPASVNPNEFTSWALTPAALQWLAWFIQAQGVKSVIELGSGLSTILLATLQRDGVLERSLSIEHDPLWYLYAQERLLDKRLLDYAQVQLCPFRPSVLHGNQVQWYDLESITLFPVDLILVDGPPGVSSPFARYPALHLLQPAMHSRTWIVLDDYYRSQEQAIAQRWLWEFPQLRLVGTVPIERGLAVFRLFSPE